MDASPESKLFPYLLLESSFKIRPQLVVGSPALESPSQFHPNASQGQNACLLWLCAGSQKRKGVLETESW